VIEVNEGELASGLTGPGRMAEPEEVISLLKDHFNKGQDLAGKKVLLTAGPTCEAIDPVRFISNHSTGKMGLAIAEECRKRGASVTLIYGPGSEPVPEGITTIRIHSAEEMFDACVDLFKDNDIAIMCAAVVLFLGIFPTIPNLPTTPFCALDFGLALPFVVTTHARLASTSVAFGTPFSNANARCVVQSKS